MKKILVTGADGFIGSHVVERLVTNGFDVRAFVFYNSFESWGWLDTLDRDILANVDVFSGDVRDPYGVKQSMHNCDAVLHLAALIGIPYSYHSPSTYIETNVSGTLNILQAARDLELSRVVHTSTSEVYGSARYTPMDESHALVGQSPYSASKIAADQLAFSFHASFATPVVTVRPFNTYGPRQSTRAVIPTIITQLLNSRRRLDLGSLSPTRDFTYVSDTAGGFIAAMQAIGVEGEVINLGSNFEISIGATAELVAKKLNIDIELNEDGQRVRPPKSEVTRLFADTSKAKKLLGWSPEFEGISGFEKGLEKTLEWYSEESNLKLFKQGRYSI